MADFNGEDLGDGTSFALIQADTDEIPSHTWDSITAAASNSAVTTGLGLEAGLILEPGIVLTP